MTKRTSLGIAYAGIIGLRRRVNNSISETLGTSVDGTYISYVQDLAIDFTYHWDDIFDRSAKKDEAQSAALSGFSGSTSEYV